MMYYSLVGWGVLEKFHDSFSGVSWAFLTPFFWLFLTILATFSRFLLFRPFPTTPQPWRFLALKHLPCLKASSLAPPCMLTPWKGSVITSGRSWARRIKRHHVIQHNLMRHGMISNITIPHYITPSHIIKRNKQLWSATNTEHMNTY